MERILAYDVRRARAVASRTFNTGEQSAVSSAAAFGASSSVMPEAIILAAILRRRASREFGYRQEMRSIFSGSCRDESARRLLRV